VAIIGIGFSSTLGGAGLAQPEGITHTPAINNKQANLEGLIKMLGISGRVGIIEKHARLANTGSDKPCRFRLMIRSAPAPSSGK
jgi:hypothetical protein